MIHTGCFNCPECKKQHKVEFDFYSVEDGDEVDEDIECSCGCEFNVECTAEVNIEFYCKHPSITKSGKKPFDINDTSTWPQENNPNQLELL